VNAKPPEASTFNESGKLLNW